MLILEIAAGILLAGLVIVASPYVLIGVGVFVSDIIPQWIYEYQRYRARRYYGDDTPAGKA